MTTKVEILRRVLCVISLGAYVFILCFATLLLWSYAIHPLAERHWAIFIPFIISLRWFPVFIFFWLSYRSVYVSRRRRGCAVLLAVISISFSYFLACLATDRISDFTHRFLEGTMDLWPCILMLLTVTSRRARVPTTLSHATTPIA